jgi:hypothetical protein
VKLFALLLAILWWAQEPLCHWPSAESHQHTGARAGGHAQGGHDHHAGSDAAHGHDDLGSGPPAPPEDFGCAEHCASLARAVPAHSPQSQPPAGPALFTLQDARPVLHACPRLRAHSGGAREAPPADLLLLASVLRI